MKAKALFPLSIGLLAATASSVDAATISGSVALPGWAVTPVGVQLEMNIIDWSIPAIVDTGTFTLGIAGTYTYVTQSAIPSGTYDLYVDGDRWLEQAAVNISVGASAIANYILLAGDCDDDEEVSIGDYARIQAAMGSTSGSLNWDAPADLNGDGWVDMMDYSLVSYYYGQVGD